LSSIRLLKAGRFRSLVFFSPHRAPNFPDVPTTAETTGHTWHKGVWRGFDMIYLDSPASRRSRRRATRTTARR
jgi:hypothetical protein